MRIKQISVKGLFGMFDHTIPLNMEDHITIIHGPNGVGKTILLKLVNAVFNGDYGLLKDIPFNEFKIEFEDGRKVCVEKDLQQKLSFYKSGEKDKKNFYATVRLPKDSKKEAVLPKMEDAISYKQYSTPTNEQTIFVKEAVAEYSTGKYTRKNIVDLPEYEGETQGFRELINSVGVYFIQCQKLFNFDEHIIDDVAGRLNVLNKIIDKRFKYKHIVINKGKGFIVITDNGDELALSNLSAGEQYELGLFYTLLFKVESNSLILIDQPEVALHVGWQIEFLRDLQEIITHTPFDVLFATHSPQIISDRWDLTVELKGGD